MMKTLYRAVVSREDSGLTALYFENKKISYKALAINIRRALSYLKSVGIRPEDTVTMALPNIPQTVYIFYALDALGAKINIIHPLSTPTQIKEAMERVGSRHVFLLETAWTEHGSALCECGAELHFVNPMYEHGIIMRMLFYTKFKRAPITKTVHSADKLYRMPEQTDIHDRDPEEDSIYLHSGGTTGVPKIIALSDRAINNLAMRVPDILGYTPEGKSMLCVLPLFHGFGLGMGLHSPLACGMSSAIMMKFDAKKAVKWIDQGKVNVIIGVPLLFSKLMASEGFASSNLKALTHCFIGGDNVLPAQLEEYNRLFSDRGVDCMLLEGFGLTESVTVCAVNTKEANREGSVGRPLSGIRVQVRDESLKLLGAGEIGEIFICSDTQMNGYLNDREATDSTLLSIDGERWIRTGDLGYIDEDGYIFLRGRKKRMFIISGINVYPSVIEKACSEHACVHEATLEFFAEPKPHTVLFLIKDRAAEKSEEQIKEELMSMLQSRFLKYELPSDIVFMEEFPRTKVGKIDHSGFSNFQMNNE